MFKDNRTLEEHYKEGDLGVVFNNAAPLTLPEVSQLLKQRSTDAAASPMIVSALQLTQMLEEQTCSAAAVTELVALRLRIAAEGLAGEGGNYHLAGLEVDDEGNVVMPAPGADSAAVPHSGDQREPLLRFEVAALATLMPKSADEAVALIPSLVRYDRGDLEDAVAILDH